MAIAGGIDVGGTKIEARLFSDSWDDLGARRIDTPLDSYENLLAGIESQYRWLEEKADDNMVPIGIGVPGLVDEKTGLAVVANLPANGRLLREDFCRIVGRNVWFENDCRAFTLSEALLGAGRNHDTVLGLIMGTGVAAGFTRGGILMGGRNGVAGELGHLPIPAAISRKFDLPSLICGCGREGCYETLISGPGMARLAKMVTGTTTKPKEIAQRAARGEADYVRVMDIWTELAGGLIQAAMLVVDPDCVVLGGGLSNIPGIEQRLMDALPKNFLEGFQPPPIFLAEGGDSSGARGAALAAVDVQGGTRDV